MVIGWPSPAAVSPLLVSFSTGPQPFDARTQGRSLRYVVPDGGVVSFSTVAWTVAPAEAPAYVVLAVRSYAPAAASCGGVTVQEVVKDLSVPRAGVLRRDAARTVQPSGAVRLLRTASAGSRPALVAV